MLGLIVNADDFGFSQEVNEGVCEAHRRGVVTDASLLVRSPHAGHALAQARRDGLTVGLHIDLVTPYAQACHPEFGPAGHLARELHNREYNRQIGGVLSCEELLKIRTEIRSQIKEFTAMAGRLPSHLDYHFGLHYLPEVMAIYLLTAEEFGLPVRWGTQYAGSNPLALAPARLCDGFRGVTVGGVELFLSLLEPPWEGAMEFLCHPGYTTPGGLEDTYNQERELELATLTDPRLKHALQEMGITLVNYDWLREHDERRA
jgi:hypothetical protein